MRAKTDVWQGTLSLMVLKTLDTLGPLHGYGIARRIEQTSRNLLSINHGTLYPVLLKLEQEGSIASEWGVSDNNRKAKFYKITRAGRKALAAEEREWQRANDILARFSELGKEPAQAIIAFEHALRNATAAGLRETVGKQRDVALRYQFMSSAQRRVRRAIGSPGGASRKCMRPRPATSCRASRTLR
jgi:transcriptional regulator